MKLLHGDCLELMKDIPDKSIDMILCDLPYGTTACKWDVVIPFEPLWTQYKRIIKDRGCIALFGSEPFSSYLRMSNIKQYKYDWIWNKDRGSNPLLSHKQPMKSHETISIFNSLIYYPQMTTGHPYKLSHTGMKHININKSKNNNSWKQTTDVFKRFPLSVQTFKYKTSGKLHTSQKPVALLEYMIKTYTLEGETVLDNCMGSGSTGVACKNLSRDFIGMEKELKYFEIAKNRIENHTPQMELIT